MATTLIGGLVALKLSDKLHLILGFSAGAVIGVAFFDLLPEAIELGTPTHSPDVVLAWSAVGFLAYLALDRIVRFHGAATQRGGFTAAVLCLHSLLDGAAIGFAFQTSHAIGLVVAIAVLAHDFSDGINTMNVVLKNRGSHGSAFRWLLLDAVAPLLGILITVLVPLPGAAFGLVLAVFGGFFLYIGASDLIPESYHAHPKFLTTAMTLTGAAVLYLAIHLIS